MAARGALHTGDRAPSRHSTPAAPGWTSGGGEPVLSVFRGHSVLIWVPSASPTAISRSLLLILCWVGSKC